MNKMPTLEQKHSAVFKRLLSTINDYKTGELVIKAYYLGKVHSLQEFCGEVQRKLKPKLKNAK